MTSLTILDLPIRDIDVPTDRARTFDEAGAQMLAGIIADQGLHHPIRVLANGDRYTLVSGLSRLRAFEILARETIPASLSDAVDANAARLEELMENLGRSELIALDRCQHLYRLKRAWDESCVRPLVEVLTEEGGKSFPTPESEHEVYGFASTVAEKVGLSKRYINLSVKIWTSLTACAVSRLPGTDLADKMTELRALSEQQPGKQRQILDLILGDDHPEIHNVASALAYLEGGVQPSGDEMRLQVLRKSVAALPDQVFDRLIAENADRTIASLKRMGRI